MPLQTTLRREVAADANPAQVDDLVAHLAMVSWMVAGIKTHYLNVRSVAAELPNVAARHFEVNPYIMGGGIERIPVLPNRVKANLRCQLTVSPLLHDMPLDAVWTQMLTPIIPFLFTRATAQRQLSMTATVHRDCWQASVQRMLSRPPDRASSDS